jgi:probable F420-dependent oxidoreductase
MPHDRKFRFGIMASRAESAKDYREQAKKAEDAGFTSLFVPDHFIDHPFAPFPAMAMVAEATSLRVGPLVLGNDYKHPVVLAREAATLDLLSEGRLELGIGAGWMTADYEKAGIPLDKPSVRIARLEESIAVLKGLWGDKPFTFLGEHYEITDLDGMPKPVQKPIPIIVGGGGKKVLSLGAREADIVGINANLRRGEAENPDAAKSATGAATDEKLSWVREAAGSRFEDIEIQQFVGFVHFTDDPMGFANAMAPAFGVEPEVALETPLVLVGSIESMIDDLLARRERWQMSYIVVNADFVEPLAPLVAKLAGT